MADEQQNDAAGAADTPAQQQFALQRVYLKDLSFESPATPGIFRQEYKPQVNVDLRTRSSKIQEDNYEIVLTITVTAKMGEQTVFLIEVQQAGIFLVSGIEGEELRQVLAIFCPNMLFPYARETIDNIATRGTFPALMLAQVNFEGLYAQAVQQAQQKAAAEAQGAEPSNGEASS
ncbi:MAG: protein-export chaperone SecB [Halieaceae bacterium]|jgi:preprotein translocase subunit SecB|nr:protein-export chaperone SecB [Halieaceae bacterium]